MTPDQLTVLRDRELIVLQLVNDGADLFIAGCCVFSDSHTPHFYTTHPLAPMSQWLAIQDQPDAFIFHPTGKLFREALRDEEFSNYYQFAVANLDLPCDDQDSLNFVAATVALTFEQAAIEADLNPAWLAGPHQIPLDRIDDVHSLMTRMDECLRSFCAQYSCCTPDIRRLH